MVDKERRLHQLNADRNVKMMDRLMQRIRNDIANIAEQSKNMKDFEKKISYYTMVNCFTSDRYGDETWKLVKTINEPIKSSR